MTLLDFNTRAIHGPGLGKDFHNGLRFPVYAGVAFDFENAADMEDVFNHRKPAHAYSRITNPTVQHFEQTLNLLEDGFGTIALSSGMAAITNVLLSILQAGENIIASKYLFGNTRSLFEQTFKGFGISTRFIDINDQQQLEKAIDNNTRALFCETITNPQMNVTDFSLISSFAKLHNLVLVADSSVTSPYLFEAKKHGVNIVVHSTTKYISGGATSVGGAIVDLGNFNWEKIPALKPFHKLEKFALIARLRKEVYRNFGSCMSAQSANLQTLGLETLSLRIDKSCDNALKIAKYLETNPNVKKVNYPGLESSKFYNIAREQFKQQGGILSFELENQETAFKFLDNLLLIKRATNLNDNKTLIIHPASTIFTDFSEKQRESMEIKPGLIRLSTGIESHSDLIQDLDQAFKSLINRS